MKFLIALVLSFLASCIAFGVLPARMTVSRSSLSMATISDTFQFRKPNRLSFKTLHDALAATGLDATLNGDGPFTVFAPTDAAFEKLPAGTLDGLLKDKEALTAILTYHVLAGKVPGSEFRDQNGKKLVTLNGKSVTVNDDIFMDDAKVNCFDIELDNGIVHAIDQVLLPK